MNRAAETPTTALDRYFGHVASRPRYEIGATSEPYGVYIHERVRGGTRQILFIARRTLADAEKTLVRRLAELNGGTQR